MSIAYPDWTPEEPEQQKVRTGMAAFLTGHGATVPRHNWKIMAISVLGHAAFLYAVLFATMTVPKKRELETITVSIAPTRVSQPEPLPLPKMERPPEVVQPKLPQIDTPAVSATSPIQVAAPVAAPVAAEKSKKSDDAAETSPPVFDAGYLNNPSPVYPNMSRRLREVGVTQLRVRVSTSGEPLEIQLFKSSGYSRLDDAARAAVQKWKFQSAKRNGSTVEAWVIVPVEFSLTRG